MFVNAAGSSSKGLNGLCIFFFQTWEIKYFWLLKPINMTTF